MSTTHGNKLGDHVRLEIEASDLSNLVSNPSGASGTTGWTADSGITLGSTTASISRTVTINGVAQGQSIAVPTGTISAAYGSGAALYAEVNSPSFSVVPGRWIGYQFSAADSKLMSDPEARVRHRVKFYDGSSNLIATSTAVIETFETGTEGDIPWQYKTWGTTTAVPTSAVTARVSFSFFDRSVNNADSKPVRNTWLSRLMVVMSENSASVTTVPFSTADVWQNIIGSSQSIRINRGGDVNGVVDDIQPGQMTAVVVDASFDPARNIRARYGRKIRVSFIAAGGGTNVQTIYTGRIATLDVDYSSTKGQTADQYKPRITISAVDAITELSSVPAPFIYSGEFNAKVGELMKLSTVPYIANNSLQVVNKIGVIENSSLWDQLLLARNSTSTGRVFVDRFGQAIMADTDNASRNSKSWSPYNWLFADRPVDFSLRNHVLNASFIVNDYLGTGTNVTSAQSYDWAMSGLTSLKLTSSSTTGAKQWVPNTNRTSGFTGATAATINVKAIVACRVRLTVKTADGTSTATDFADLAAGAVGRLKISPLTIPSGKSMTDYSFTIEVTKSGTATAWDTVGDLIYVDRLALFSMNTATIPKFKDWWFDGNSAVEYLNGSATDIKTAELLTTSYGGPLDISSAQSGANMSYVDYSAALGSKSIVNSLTITKTNDNEPDGAKTYGPYLNQGSVVDWGAASAQLDVIDGDPSTLATAYLQKFANPGVTLSSMTVDVTGPNEFVNYPYTSCGPIDLYDKVSFGNSISKIYGVYLVIGVEHEITPDRWWMTVRTKPLEQTYQVTVNNSSGSSNAGPQDVVGPTGRAIELPSAVNLNSYTSPGVYAQTQNTDAAAGTNYPVPQAGLLEVAANDDLSMVWQRYTVYNGGTFGGMTLNRTYYASAWSAWAAIGNVPRGSRSLSSSATRTVANNTVTVVPLDTDKGIDGMLWDDTNKAFTVQIAGMYQINASVTYKPGATSGRCECKVYVNSTQKLGALIPFPSVSNYATTGTSGLLRLNVGDAVSLRTSQSSGATQTIHDPDWAWLDVLYMGPQ